jgi:cell pole-organizing protein PopZ
MSFSSNDIYNAGGPGSSAEPSMEEILASIRRILKEDDTIKSAPLDLDDDVLVLDQSMIAKPADFGTATYMPLEVPAPEPAPEPLQSSPEPLHFSSEPTPFAGDFLPAPAAVEPEFPPPPAPSFIAPPEMRPEIPAAPFIPEPQPAPYEPPVYQAPPPPPAYQPPPALAPVIHPPIPDPIPPATPQLETKMTETSQDSVEPPHSLMSDKTTDAAATSIGALVRSMSTEKSVAISRHGVTIEDIVREEIRPLLKSWLDTHLPSLVERVVRTEIERVIDRSGS